MPPDGLFAVNEYESERVAVEPESNYTSEIFRARVQYECEDRLPKEDFLLFKLTLDSKESEKYGTKELFVKEAYLYDNVFGKMAALAVAADHFPVPKHYCTVAESQVLVMEDLARQGYRMKSKEAAGLNFELSARVLEELAVFHATSVKCDQLHPAIMWPAVQQEMFYTRSLAEALRKSLLPVLLRVLRLDLVSESVLANFAEYAAGLTATRMDVCEVADRVCQFDVLNHGNLKMPNMLFKEDGASRPASVVLLDFQTCRWNSPALDLIFFCMNSVHCSLFVERREQLLERYLSQLNGTLSALECGCSYTRNEYETDEKGCRPFQVLTLLWTGLADVGTTVRRKIFAQQDDSVTDDDVLEIRRSPMFQNRFFPWFCYFKEQGFFDA